MQNAVSGNCPACARRREPGSDARSMSRDAWSELGESEPSTSSSCQSKLATLDDPCNISHDHSPCMNPSYQQKTQAGEVDLVPAPPESYSCHVCRQDVGARVSVDQVVNPMVDHRMHESDHLAPSKYKAWPCDRHVRKVRCR